MNKAKKILLVILGVFVLIIVTTISIVHISKQAPVNYLVEKYDIDRKELHCVKYSPKHCYYDLDYFKYGWTTTMWIYKYDDNEFIVKKINDEYCDDFQYDEYRNWCIDFLSSELNERVISVSVESLEFFEDNRKLTTTDFRDMLCHNESMGISITFDDINPYTKDKELVNEVAENIVNRSKQIEKLNITDIEMIDKSIEFTKSFTYYGGDRNYRSIYDYKENSDVLEEQGKYVYVWIH